MCDGKVPSQKTNLLCVVQLFPCWWQCLEVKWMGTFFFFSSSCMVGPQALDNFLELGDAYVITKFFFLLIRSIYLVQSGLIRTVNNCDNLCNFLMNGISHCIQEMQFFVLLIDLIYFHLFSPSLVYQFRSCLGSFE